MYICSQWYSTTLWYSNLNRSFIPYCDVHPVVMNYRKRKKIVGWGLGSYASVFDWILRCGRCIQKWMQMNTSLQGQDLSRRWVVGLICIKRKHLAKIFFVCMCVQSQSENVIIYSPGYFLSFAIL